LSEPELPPEKMAEMSLQFTKAVGLLLSAALACKQDNIPATMWRTALIVVEELDKSAAISSGKITPEELETYDRLARAKAKDLMSSGALVEVLQAVTKKPDPDMGSAWS